MGYNWHVAYKQFLINLHSSQKVTQKVTTVRYLFTVELISWWNFHKFNIWILSNSFFIVKWWAKFSALLQICFWSSVSLFNLAICIINCRTKMTGIQQEKAAWCFPWVKLKCLIWCYFSGQKRPDLHATLQQKNDQIPKLETYIWIYLIKILSLLFSDWGEVFSLHQSLMEVDNTFVRSLNVFEEKIVEKVIEIEYVSWTSIVFCFLKTEYEHFCLTCSLIDRCQIVTDHVENVSKFVSKPFKSPYHYTNKYILV